MKKLMLSAVAAAMLSSTFAAPAFASTKAPVNTAKPAQLVSAHLPAAKNTAQDYRKMLRHAGLLFVVVAVRLQGDRHTIKVKASDFDH
jgi:hypothetical protein